MSDLKLFQLNNNRASELHGSASDLEKSLQTLIENNLEILLGVRFLATEYPTGKTHGGRIDTLGLDENSCPVILEYKRSVNENVMNQGLFYLDWLMDHKGEFWKLVTEKFGKELADKIDWSAPRLICIASDFTKYDEHAVQQIARNIELIRYKKFGSDLLLLELVNAVSGQSSSSITVAKQNGVSGRSAKLTDKTYAMLLAEASPTLTELDEAIRQFMHSLGDDVQENVLKKYVAYKKLRNFATVVVGNKQRLLLQLHLNPDSYPLAPSVGRDTRGFGTWGTGDLQLFVENTQDVELAKPLILKAYEGG